MYLKVIFEAIRFLPFRYDYLLFQDCRYYPN